MHAGVPWDHRAPSDLGPDSPAYTDRCGRRAWASFCRGRRFRARHIHYQADDSVGSLRRQRTRPQLFSSWPSLRQVHELAEQLGLACQVSSICEGKPTHSAVVAGVFTLASRRAAKAARVSDRSPVGSHLLPPVIGLQVWLHVRTRRQRPSRNSVFWGQTVESAWQRPDERTSTAAARLRVAFADEAGTRGAAGAVGVGLAVLGAVAPASAVDVLKRSDGTDQGQTYFEGREADDVTATVVAVS